MTAHAPIYHKSGKHACGKRIPDAHELVRYGLSTTHGDQVCQCPEPEVGTNHFTSQPQPADLKYYDKR